MLWRWKRLASPGDGGHQEEAVAFLEGAGFAAEEADVFFVEVDVEELANLALVVADVARQIGIARRKFIQRVGGRGCATVHLGGAFGEAAESWWNFDGHGH